MAYMLEELSLVFYIQLYLLSNFMNLMLISNFMLVYLVVPALEYHCVRAQPTQHRVAVELHPRLADAAL